MCRKQCGGASELCGGTAANLLADFSAVQQQNEAARQSARQLQTLVQVPHVAALVSSDAMPAAKEVPATLPDAALPAAPDGLGGICSFGTLPSNASSTSALRANWSERGDGGTEGGSPMGARDTYASPSLVALDVPIPSGSSRFQPAQRVRVGSASDSSGEEDAETAGAEMGAGVHKQAVSSTARLSFASAVDGAVAAAKLEDSSDGTEDARESDTHDDDTDDQLVEASRFSFTEV